MVDHYRGDMPIQRGPKIRILRITTSDARMFGVCSPCIYGQNVHWAFNRSHECQGDKAACDGCGKLWPTKWLGYLLVTDQLSMETHFLELTHSACEMLLKQAHEGQSLRGLLVKIAKTKGGAKGRFRIEVLERRYDEDVMVKDVDPLPTLRFLWNCKKKSRSDLPVSL